MVVQAHFDAQQEQQQSIAEQLQASEQDVDRLRQQVHSQNGSLEQLLHSFLQQQEMVQDQAQSFQQLLMNHLQQQKV